MEQRSNNVMFESVKGTGKSSNFHGISDDKPLKLGAPVLHKHINQQENWSMIRDKSTTNIHKKHSLLNDSIFEMCWVSLPQAFGGLGSNLVSLAIFVWPQDAPDISSWNVSTSEAIMLNPKKSIWPMRKVFSREPLKMFGTWQQRRPQRMIPLRANCTASAPDNASTSRMTCPTNLQSVWIKTLPAIHQHQRSWCSGKIFIHKYLYLYIYCIVTDLTANIFDGFWTWPQAVDFISSRGPHGCWLAKRQAEPSGAMSNGGLVRSTVGEITNWKARSTGSSAVNISMKHETSWHQDVAVSFQPEAYLCTGLGPNLPWLFGHRQSFSSFSAMVLVQSDTAELDIWSSRSIHLTSTPLEYQAIIIGFIFQRFECKLWDLHRYHRSTGGNRESHSVKCPEIRSSSPKWSF